MKKYSPQQWIEPLTESVEAHLIRATEVYQNLSDADMNTPPADGGWSVAQCLEHLNSYGHFYLPAVRKALHAVASPAEPSGGTYRSGWLGRYFINMMKPENTKKFKAFKGHIPAPKLDGAAVVAEFIEQQEQWLRLLDEVNRVAELNARVPISISPLVRLKLGDVFGFVIAHNARHIQQADRVLAGTLERA
ncbi:DinB family protein [Salmonirosea aquatica]|uniref:DinB family protein n=1 Tax=Salmonirosea aquatica TaxID=2654236 RepID=A0A7C9FRA4_9BACT|nr:DinB family protein [Cytophagaceae bacterium SJW1-29]